MSTFYAAFRDPEKAEFALRAILNDGIPADGVSLLTSHEDGDGKGSGLGHLGDATSFVGREDDPTERLGTLASGVGGYEHESNISAGIATDSPDDAAESIDQMDDSQWQAELNMVEPDNDEESAEEDEQSGLSRALSSGFATPVSVIDVVSLQPGLGGSEVDSVELPGFAVIRGGGALATAAIASDERDRRESLLRFFADEGVPARKAQEFIDTFQSGGAVLAVEVVPGEVDPDRVAFYANQNGASEGGMYDAPRF